MTTPSTQLYPEVVDASNVGARLTQPLFLPIGIEGQADADGTATIKQIYTVARPIDAEGLFGVAASLTNLIKWLMDRGISPVYAVASKKSVAPTLVERQAAWDELSSDPVIRIRLTDAVAQAEHVALATSCVQAELANNKQFCIVGMAAATAKATLTTAAAAIASKRAVLVAPAVYNEAGTLMAGSYAAASVAAEVAKNSVITDDLDTAILPKLADIEHDALSAPLFRVKITGGTLVNDHEDLLQGGVSSLRRGINGGVEITHLRTTYITDGTFDALMTRLIADQLFLDIRSYLTSSNFLRLENTQATRDMIKAGVEAVIVERSAWVNPTSQSNGALGYNVQVISSADQRQITVSYSGEIVRGTSTIVVSGILTVAV